MKGQLSRLEARIEALIEGTLTRFFGERIQPRDLAIQLVRALEDSASAGQPATQYRVRLNPADAAALEGAQPALADSLAEELVRVAREAHFMLAEKPTIVFEADAAQKPRTLSVSTDGAAGLSATQGMAPVEAPMRQAPRAYLILNGERIIPLGKAQITLGRRLDNEVVIDDLRVSRAHAQLRLRFGRYVIYDLGSSSGTFVNGQSVEACILRPGDVISLGGVSLVYGEEDEEPPAAGRAPGAEPPQNATRPLKPPGPADKRAG